MKNFLNLLIKLKNGQLSKKLFLFHKKTNISELLLKTLWKNNFIIGYKINNFKLKIILKYFNNKPVISSFKFIKNFNNFHLTTKQIWSLNIKNNYFCFVSTSYGIKSLNNCKTTKIGGKILFLIK